MSLLAPIICDNGTGYSKVGYVLDSDFLCAVIFTIASVVLLETAIRHCEFFYYVHTPSH
jgi:hypothetical protein